MAPLLPSTSVSTSSDTRARKRRFSSASSCFSSALRTSMASSGRVERLGHEIIGAAAHGADGVLDRGVRRDQDHFGGGVARFGGGQHFHARAVRHREVGEHDRKGCGFWLIASSAARQPGAETTA